MDPNGRLAIVTGGASGLGAATVAALADAGASVAILDLAESAPGPGILFPCDVTDADAVASTVAAIVDRLGPVHLCVNAAGIGGLGAIATAEGPGDIAAFRRVVDVNLTGAAIVAAQVAHRMIGNAPVGPDGERGVIVNACSIASFEGQAGMGPYTASKAALAALTLVWARDLSAHAIRVMGIAPGLFDTPMTCGIPDALAAELRETMEFPRRAGTAAEFADLVLAIVRMPMLNADVIRIDGGTRPPARTRWATGPTGA